MTPIATAETARGTELSFEAVSRALAGRTPVECRVPGLRASAVLVPLFTHPADGSTRLWLMKRTEDGGAHGGQVALPGGKYHPSDGDLQATALREAWEELGIPPASVRVIGALDEYPTITGFRIRPYVGWIPSDFVPVPNPGEVARHFHAPLSMFLGTGTRSWVRWAQFSRLVRAYEVDGAVVWGATAAILRRFGEILSR